MPTMVKNAKKNRKKGKADKTAKSKLKAKAAVEVSKTNLKAPPKPSDSADDDSHHPQPRMYVSLGRNAKTKAIKNMYCTATGRRLLLSESDVLRMRKAVTMRSQFISPKREQKQLD